MGIIVAIVFLGIAVVSLAAYGGTPHGGPTTSCGPIDIFGHTFDAINADCRLISISELAVAGIFFFLALMIGLSSRPRN